MYLGAAILIVLVLLGGPIIPSSNFGAYARQKRNTDCNVGEYFHQLETFIELHNLRFVTTKDDLNHFCSVSKLGYERIKELYDDNSPCLSEEQRDLFPNYEMLANSMHDLLCLKNTTVTFKYDLLNHSACIIHQREDILRCFRQHNVPEIPMLSVVENGTSSLAEKAYHVCCSVERYVHCVTQLTNATCGPRTSNMFSFYVQHATGTEVMGFCHQLGYSRFPRYLDQPCRSGSYTESQEFLAVLVLILFIWNVIYFVIPNPCCSIV